MGGGDGGLHNLVTTANTGKIKLMKQEQEEKNSKVCRDAVSLSALPLPRLHSLPVAIVRNWKTISNHLPGAAEQFSPIRKQFELG